MKYTTFASLAVVTALGFLTPINANAFGLGKIELSSALNEPFKAEISVTALRDDDAENLEIRLASNDEFIKAGLERSLILTQLKFELVEKPKGLVILVSSKQAVKEPFLDFLLTATTGEGKLIREYTVLLDPPKEVFNRPAEVKVTSVPPATTNNSTAPKANQNKTTYQYPSSDISSASSYGPTGRTDTLWDIALKTRPQTSVSVHQMMMAILKENPRAFTKDNINGLKAGYTLDLPSADIIEQLSKAQAVSSVAEQNTSWKNRNKTLARVDTTIAQGDTSITGIEQQDEVVESDDMSATSTDSTSSSSGESDAEAHLQLVVPADDSSMNDEDLSLSGNKELRKLSEQLTLAEETLEGQVQENIEFKSRMSAMEEQLETMRRLISLKDADLARLQSSLEQEQATTSEPSDEMTSLHEEAIALLDQYAEDANLGEETDQDTSIGIDEEMVLLQDGDVSLEDTVELLELGTTEQLASETVTDEMDLSDIPFAEDIISKTSEIMDIDEGEIKSTITGVKQFVTEHKIETALGGVLILLLLLLFIRNRKNAGVSWDEAVEKLPDTPTSTSTPTVMIETPETDDENIVASEKESINDDFQVKTVEDFIEQADIFVGYADYEQAKTSLDLAKEMEPGNEKVIQKLLFIAFKQQEVNTFIDLAGQTAAERNSAEWEEITVWGRELAPEHDMFKLDETDIEPLSADIEDEVISEVEETLNIDIEEEEESNHLEFNLDESNSDDVAEDDLDNTSAETRDDELLDFDINSDDDSDDLEIEAPLSSENSDPDDAISDNGDLSFDVDGLSDFDAPLTMGETSLNDDEVLESDDEPMTLDLSESDTDIGSIELGALGSVSEQELDAATRELSESLEDSIEMGEDSDTADLTFDIGEIDEIDETETKLDLADAYMDMGDPEGARSILEEVMADANDEQKERAQRMLKDL